MFSRVAQAVPLQSGSASASSKGAVSALLQSTVQHCRMLCDLPSLRPVRRCGERWFGDGGAVPAAAGWSDSRTRLASLIACNLPPTNPLLLPRHGSTPPGRPWPAAC